MTTETTNEELIPYQVFTDDVYFLSREQAEAADAVLCNLHARKAILFTVFVGLRGHEALGMNLSEYCESRSVDRRSAYQWFEQVAVALNLACMTGETLVDQVDQNAVTLALPSRRVAAELRQLSEVDQRSVAERYEAILHHPLTATGKVKFDQVQNIVKQFLPKPIMIYVPPTPPSAAPSLAPQSVYHGTHTETAPEILPPAVSPRNEHKPFVAPPESLQSAVSQVEPETDVDDLTFPDGDKPDYIASNVEYDSENGGFWIYFEREDGATESVYVTQADINTCPTR